MYNFYSVLPILTRFPKGIPKFVPGKLQINQKHITMKANFKARYETPSMQVVELQVKASLCTVSNHSIDWTYDTDVFRPDQNLGWDRPGYGDVVEF